MTLLRRITIALGAVFILAGFGAGVASAATVPPHTPPYALIHERNVSDVPVWLKLQDADPFTGRYGYEPLGNGMVSHVRWTSVNSTTVNGTGEWNYGFMGLCVNGPVSIALHGTGWKYGTISVTLLQYWVTNTGGHTACPPDGHGTAHSTAHSHLATNDPTLNLIHF
jgi:hypothetical protein